MRAKDAIKVPAQQEARAELMLVLTFLEMRSGMVCSPAQPAPPAVRDVAAAEADAAAEAAGDSCQASSEARTACWESSGCSCERTQSRQMRCSQRC